MCMKQEPRQRVQTGLTQVALSGPFDKCETDARKSMTETL